jgi:glycosyltransferase involved in cell wall biosynthesis
MMLRSLPAQPLVSIVTPSYNMGRFLGETMESVLSQDYPNIEYIVIDGGSSDNTLDVLRDYEARYPGRFTWISERDGGQSDAINKGFLRCKGEIFTFLNSDDTYLPGAVRAAVEAFASHTDAAVVYGDAWYTDEQNTIIKKYPVDPYDYERLGSLCHICQPAAFIRAEVFRQVGMLDVGLHLTLDYDLWLKISALYPMFKIDRPMANSRMWADNKTLSRRRTTFQEVVQILRMHRGYVPVNWTYGYAQFLLDGKDGFYQISAITIPGVALATAMGLWFNRTRPWKFLAECGAHLGIAGRMYWARNIRARS